MEITYMSLIAVVSCIVFSAGIWKFLNWAWLTPKKLEKKLRDQGFNGHPYRFLLGEPKDPELMKANFEPMNLYDDDVATKIMGHFLQLVKEFGNYVFAWSGTRPVLVITEPELVKEITFRNYHFPRVPQNPLARLLMKGVQGLDRDEWAKHRKIIAPAFHLEKIKLMIPAFYTCITEMLNKWEDIVSSTKGSAEVDVWPYLQMLTADAISRTAFGSNYEEGRAIFELQKEQARYYIKVITSLQIPGWRFVPTKMHRRMKEISRIVDSKIRRVIDERMKATKAGGARGDDFLGLLLESNSKEIDECGSKELGLSIQDVIEECKVLYFAGQETTSVLLVWTMILLGKNPEWQDRAREEVFQLFGNHQIPDYTTLNHLKIVTMILYEVLRLYTPVSGMHRITTEETKLGNFTIPKGVILLIPGPLLHFDPKTWGDDAKKFNPERFAEGISNVTKGQVSYIPFSWGPRICLGQHFALMEAKMAISMILRQFSFEVAPSYTHLPHHSSLTLQPNYGAQLILHKLQNK